jgi:hypothetical protein
MEMHRVGLIYFSRSQTGRQARHDMVPALNNRVYARLNFIKFCLNYITIVATVASLLKTAFAEIVPYERKFAGCGQKYLLSY